MTSILEEYRRRHGLSSLTPVTEGLLFLESPRKQFICLTSSPSKQFVSCVQCRSMAVSHKIILEVFQQGRFPNCCQALTHTHIDPDAELVEQINALGVTGDPFISKGTRSQEQWLWNFFKKSHPRLGEGVHLKFESWQDEVFYYAMNHNRVFKVYYDNLYLPFMVNRKYILVE